jgi:ferredoxin
VIDEAAQASRLVYNDYCVSTLAKHAFALRGGEGRVALVVRGCDSRGINRMIADNQLTRDELYLLGVSCQGMKNRATDGMLARCIACLHTDPVVFDEMLDRPSAGVSRPDAPTGADAANAPAAADAASTAAAADAPPAAASADAASADAASVDAALIASPISADAAQERFAAVKAVEAQDRGERKTRFDAAFARCIRCYACRNVCPVCTCRECFVDQQRVGWQGKQGSLAENRSFNLTRVFHVGDRCVECGECERACPMELPLMELNRKFIKDLTELFAADEEGLAAEPGNTLGRYDVADVEEFM